MFSICVHLADGFVFSSPSFWWKNEEVFLESKFAHYSLENTQTAGLWQQKEEKHLMDKVFNHFKHNCKQELSGYVITEAQTGPDV